MTSVVCYAADRDTGRLAREGRSAEAMEVLCALEDKAHDHPSVQQTFRGIQDAVAAERRSPRDGFPLRHVFTGGPNQNFRRVALGVVSQCFQQITGINLIT